MPVPEEYQQSDHVVRCMNYPDSDKVNVIDANVNETINSPDPTKSYYSQLQPNFVEDVNWVTNQQDVDELKCLFDKFISDVKSRYQQVHPVNQDQIYISSNMPVETSKKHHGCTGWSESRKRK